MSRRAQMSECGGARIRRGVCGREVCLKAIVTRPDVVIALLHAKLAWTHVMAISTASSSDRCKLIVYTVLYGAFAPWLCHHPPAGFFNNKKMRESGACWSSRHQFSAASYTSTRCQHDSRLTTLYCHLSLPDITFTILQ
jgi:hypothetical protein